MLNVLLEHPLLGVVCHIWECLLKVRIGLFEVSSELSELHIESLSFKLDASLGSLCGDAAHRDQEMGVALFESASVQDIDLLAFEEVAHSLEVGSVHVAREVAGDATLVREVDLGVRLLVGEDFLLNLGEEFVKNSAQGLAFLAVALQSRVRVQDALELVSLKLRHELEVTEGVIVAKVSVEATNIGQEVLPFISGDSALFSRSEKIFKISASKVSLEDNEERRCLIGELMEDHPGAGPGSFRHVVGVVPLLVGEVFPRFSELEVLHASVLSDMLCHLVSQVE